MKVILTVETSNDKSIPKKKTQMLVVLSIQYKRSGN